MIACFDLDGVDVEVEHQGCQCLYLYIVDGKSIKCCTYDICKGKLNHE